MSSCLLAGELIDSTPTVSVMDSNGCKTEEIIHHAFNKAESRPTAMLKAQTNQGTRSYKQYTFFFFEGRSK